MTARKYAPDRIGVHEGRGLRTVPVTRLSAYPPGKHPPGSPIRPEWWALALHNEVRTRWYGFRKCYIGSSLRMVCELDPGQARDEILALWDDVEEHEPWQ